MDNVVAYCGLFCKSCGVFIATENNDIQELNRISELMKTTLDEIRCKGCRSNILSLHCRNCEFRTCAQKHGYNNCEDCSDFPCDKLVDFQSKLPHRAELFESAKFRKMNGIESWMKKMTEDYECKRCHTINSPYYICCKKCGAESGNDFIERNISILKR